MRKTYSQEYSPDVPLFGSKPESHVTVQDSPLESTQLLSFGWQQFPGSTLKPNTDTLNWYIGHEAGPWHHDSLASQNNPVFSVPHSMFMVPQTHCAVFAALLSVLAHFGKHDAALPDVAPLDMQGSLSGRCKFAGHDAHAVQAVFHPTPASFSLLMLVWSDSLNHPVGQVEQPTSQDQGVGDPVL